MALPILSTKVDMNHKNIPEKVEKCTINNHKVIRHFNLKKT